MELEEEFVLVYIAKRLKEALAIEKLFTDSGLDYVVEPDTYSGGVIFRTERTGAFFYVTPENQTIATDILKRNNYTALI
jgi:vacuolar-type H+-ATPase subunit E/Vma4